MDWFPADFITESFPGQFRNWFYAILTMSTVLEKKPPFRVLLGHAQVHDERGEEMHKSKGNAIWFDEAAEKMGADVMRWMFAKHNPLQNVNFGYGPGTEIKKILLQLWNVYSFFVTYAEIDGWKPTVGKPDPKTLLKLDRWVISRMNSLIKSGEKDYDNYDLMALVKETEAFFEDLSNWYLRRNRKRFWKSENDADKNTAYQVLYQALVNLVKVIAPILPFTMEELYQNLVRSVDRQARVSVHLCDFPAWDEGSGTLRDYYTVSASPRFDKLGPKLGKLLTPAAAWIKGWTGEEIKEFQEQGHKLRGFDGTTVDIIPEDVEIKKNEVAGWSLAFEDELGVAVRIEITAELESEGLVRELIHKIQMLRKEANFDLVDRIRINCRTDEKLRAAMEKHREYLKNETLALEIAFAEDHGEIDKEMEINGIPVKISLTRIKG
jgi:isoleucyl-tRNA synthetase